MKNLHLTLLIFLLLIGLNISALAQDWGNLGRFNDKNAMLAPPTKDEKRIVFMGDSITEGWLQDSTNFFYTKPYVNRGISGQTTPQMLVRFRADVINLKPVVVVILAGINDIAGNTGPSTIEMITNNIMSMAELAKAHNIKVVLCAVLPAFDFPWKPDMEPAEKVVDLNSRLKVYAESKGMIYCDYFTPMVDKQNGLKEALTYDGVHPNDAGYQMMIPIVEKAIKKALIN